MTNYGPGVMVGNRKALGEIVDLFEIGKIVVGRRDRSYGR